MSIVENCVDFVKEKLQNAEAGHDWNHIHRVWQLSKIIAEGEAVDMEIVELSALLHDIADAKFHEGDEEIGPKIAVEYLTNQKLAQEKIDHIYSIIRFMSFKGGHNEGKFYSKEFAIVQDADRLDALGAIGIARTFNFGGFKNNPMFDPLIEPVLHQNVEEYKKNKGTTINHFYEKLFLLKDKMNTEKAKLIAKERHDYMLEFVERFKSEWFVNQD